MDLFTSYLTVIYLHFQPPILTAFQNRRRPSALLTLSSFEGNLQVVHVVYRRRLK